MNTKLRADADAIIQSAIAAVLPDAAVARALEKLPPPAGRLVLVAAGKAAWQMAKAAREVLAQRASPLHGGIVITKYGHVKAPLPGILCREAGHPVPDAAGFAATAEALALVRGLGAQDAVLFLLSGGGSALFEAPLIPGEELQAVTAQLLACGADITEMNTVRKRLSAVKGGRFAEACAPANVFGVVLSDIVGDPLDMIASGPAVPDSTTCADALAVAEKYDLILSDAARECLAQETPKTLANVENRITGSVRQLCAAAAQAAAERGYTPVLLTDCLTCQAKEAGSFLASILRTHAARKPGEKLAFLAGGETVVRLTGKGLGGRNQELALAAAAGIDGMANAAVFSGGSDGTDGPTDAAGGYADGDTAAALRAARTTAYPQGAEIWQVLEDNDAYHALQAMDGLLFTGPTGTNVNDVAVALLGYRSAKEPYIRFHTGTSFRKQPE